MNSEVSLKSFWTSVNILIKKPHVVNKKLWGSKTLFTKTCISSLPSLDVIMTSDYECLQDVCHLGDYLNGLFMKLQLEEHFDENSTIKVILTELLPKNYGKQHAFQLIVVVREKAQVLFYNVTPKDVTDQNLCPEFSYILKHEENKIVLRTVADVSSKSYQWLTDSVVPQLVRWAKESPDNVGSPICNESLSLVSCDSYYKKYNDLKIKYGKEMVKIWPECTDPAKFVYEDIAIATYLLLLWEDERMHQSLNHKQTFVDLGCGNGLLVYILSQEGHQGVGLDVRKRNIWDMYPDGVHLEEKTVTPSDINLFPEADWLIGNHSDELTPWIPVIAARSSYKCNFFLLPCCAFNFDGTRYQRQDSSKSQYTQYLQYIKQLSEDCGFSTDADRLKIPSTKRICIVGRGRSYPEDQQTKYCSDIQNIIENGSNTQTNNNENWINGFKARDAVEKVRNCTQIDKQLIERIVQTVSHYLLKSCNVESCWSPGDNVEISELVKLIAQEDLKKLKSECGGFQTLLKNNHNIFKVQSGKVQLRHPKTVDEVTKGFQNKRQKVEAKIRQKPCWFYNNHPQGCPLTDVTCSFLHKK